MRTIRHGDKEFTAHGYCLTRLRRLACNINGMRPAMPTLARPLTLNEFLLVKRPRDAAEILCCIAFHHQIRNDQEAAISKVFVEDQLQLSPFKIADISAAFQIATEVLGYFICRTERGSSSFVLTEKGRQVVSRLPPLPE
ncbi:MAG: hypothetical protein ACFFCB_07215 [Candidatus Odinarchaeota archaeon]